MRPRPSKQSSINIGKFSTLTDPRLRAGIWGRFYAGKSQAQAI
jgi:hypothetical protein